MSEARQGSARNDVASLFDPRAFSKLRWRCRRGLLENDLFVERFFERHGATLTSAQAQGLEALMDLSDNDLLDLLLAREEPDGRLLGDPAVQVLHLMRTPRQHPKATPVQSSSIEYFKECP